MKLNETDFLPDWISINVIARKLGISRHNAMVWVVENSIGYKKQAGGLRYSKSDVLETLNKLQDGNEN